MWTMTDAWEVAHAKAIGAAERNDRRLASSTLAAMVKRQPRFELPLVSHFDWDRLRVNVYAQVAPELVKWR